jgi:hypothetical protein
VGDGGQGALDQSRAGLVMPDVVRRLVEHRAAQPVEAADARDQEMTHARPSAAASRAGVQMRGSIRPPAACSLAVRTEELRAKAIRKSREVRNLGSNHQGGLRV